MELVGKNVAFAKQSGHLNCCNTFHLCLASFPFEQNYFIYSGLPNWVQLVGDIWGKMVKKLHENLAIEV